MKTALIDPERQFLGCVMQLPTTPARRLLAGMRADDFGSPVAAHVLQLSIELVAADQTATPLALMDRARERNDIYPQTSPAPRSGAANRLQALGLWIADTYSDGPILPPSYYGSWLKALVLKGAYRRAVLAHAVRLEQAVAQETSTGYLRDQLDDTEHLDDLWRRYQEADGSLPRLEVAA
ncbi:hypothetical protein ABT256_07235 [Amycolatopsis japonica]|uniref:hypothetical protein n=1 Tax=Amycolatopsis japonica TaxID=208439 RepID=UPI00331F281C